MTPDDIAGTDTDQAAYAEAAHSRDSRPDADESVAAIRALCDLCETHDLPMFTGLTPARHGRDWTAIRVSGDDWGLWHAALATHSRAGSCTFITNTDADGTQRHSSSGDWAGHRYQLVSVVG